MALSLLVVFALATGACDGQKTPSATKAFFVTETGTKNKDCTTWQNACDLQSAIDKAEKDATKKVVLVAKGSYYADPNKTDATKTFVLKDGVKIYGGFDPSDMNKARDFTASILEGELKAKEGTNEAIHTKRILKGKNLSEGTILDGFLIQNALNTDSDILGGALRLEKSSPQLNNLTFYNNKLTGSSSGGGAIYNEQSKPSISNSSFSKNSTANSGGAIYNLKSSPSISNSSFDNNSTTYGGAIYNKDSSSSISNSKFNNNSAKRSGGAIFNYHSSPSISNTTFSNNSAKKYGGAIHNYNSSPSISNSSFSENSSDFSGGAIFNYNNSSPKIYNSILWDNRDKHKGTEAINNIYNYEAASQPIVKNSILNGNSAVTKQGDNHQLDFSKTDPYDFTASDAKFKDNQTPTTFDIDAVGKVASASQVLIKDKGDNVLYKEVTKKEASEDKDLDGNPRLQGGTIDIGPYEIQN